MGKFFKTAASLTVITGTRGSGKTTHALKLDPNFIETDEFYRTTLTTNGFTRKLLKKLSKYGPSEKVVIEGALLGHPKVLAALKKHHTIESHINLSPLDHILQDQRQKRRAEYVLSDFQKKVLPEK
jgi:hypothetical protein